MAQFVLRKENDTDNPVLAVPYGKQSTAGRLAYYDKIDGRTVLISLLGEGEMDGLDRVYYNGEIIPEFGSNGQRNWKFHPGTYTDKVLGYDDPVQGRPELIPNLDFTFSGIAYIELAVPEQFVEENADPDKLKVMVRGRRVHDYVRGPAAGYTQVPGTNIYRSDIKIFSSNNALVAADIMKSFMKLPDERINWESVVDFKDRCGEVVTWAASGTGATGEYYNDQNLTNLAFIRTDTRIDFNFDYYNPTPSAGEQFSVRWRFKLNPKHSSGTQTYTFYSNHDDGARLYINGNLIIDDWHNGAQRERSGTFALTAGQTYDVVYEYYQYTALGVASLEWSSPTLAREFIPQTSMNAEPRPVPRFDADIVFPGAIDAVTALENIMLRAPGCHWQDVNGKITFLTMPNRPVVHRFTYDPTQTVKKSNIVQNSFSAYRKAPDDKPNFLRLSFRNKDEEFYAKAYSYADRPKARDEAGMLIDPGMVEIGVARQSLADRIAETQLRLLNDLDLFVSVKGQAGAFHVAKGDVVELSHDVPGWRESSPPRFMVISETFDSSIETADERSFELQVYSPTFYSDDFQQPEQAIIPTDLTNPAVPPSMIENLVLTQTTRVLSNGTVIPIILGQVTFAPHPYRQVATVYIKRPNDLDYIVANVTPLAIGATSENSTAAERTVGFEVQTVAGTNWIRVVSASAGGNYIQPRENHPAQSIGVTGIVDIVAPNSPGALTHVFNDGIVTWSWGASTTPGVIYELRDADTNNIIFRGNALSYNEPFTGSIMRRRVYSYNPSVSLYSSASSYDEFDFAPPTAVSGYDFTLYHDNFFHLWSRNAANQLIGRYEISDTSTFTNIIWSGNTTSYLERIPIGTGRTVNRYIRAVNRFGIAGPGTLLPKTFATPAAPTALTKTEGYPSTAVFQVTPPTGLSEANVIQTVVELSANASFSPLIDTLYYNGMEQSFTVAGRSNLGTDGTMYVRVRYKDFFGTGSFSPSASHQFIPLTSVDIGPGAITRAAFATGITPVGNVSALPALPDPLYPIGSLVTLSIDGKLYRNVANSWTKAVDTADLSGLIDLSQLANNVPVVRIVSALPTLPNSTYPNGATVSLTTDGKLYRNNNGTWTSAVATTDLSGLVNLSQLATDVPVIRIVSMLPTLPNSTYPNGAVVSLTTDGKLYRNSGGTWTSAVATTDLSGLVSAAQLAADVNVPKVVSALPTLPSSTYPQGALVVLTTDNRLYRSTGSSWTAEVPASVVSGTIVGTQIADGSITTPKMTANTINGDRITAGTLDAGKITANTITTGQILAGGVNADRLAAGSITTNLMTAGTINGDRISTNTLNADRIVSNSITTSQIAAGQVNGDRITAGTLNADRIIAGTITTNLMTAGTINGDRISTNTLNADRIVSNSITTAQIAAGQVNGDRITANTLNADRIIAGTITTNLMTANSINGDRITANTLNADRIVANTITTAQIAAGQVLGDRITAGTLNADRLVAFSITAGQLATDSVVARTIAVGAVTANKIAAAVGDFGIILSNQLVSRDFKRYNPNVAHTETAIWINKIGVSPTGDGGLQKTRAGDVWDSGASSTRAIFYGNGYIEFECTPDNPDTAAGRHSYRMIGLNWQDTSSNYTDLNAAWSLVEDSSGLTLQIYEGGTQYTGFGNWKDGTRLKIAIEGNQIVYYKDYDGTGYVEMRRRTATNDTLAGIQYPMRVDVSLYSNGATIPPISIYGILCDAVGSAPTANWTGIGDTTGLTILPNGGLSIAVDAGYKTVNSVETIDSGDGYVEGYAPVGVSGGNGWTMGLARNDTGDIGYAVHHSSNGTLYVNENGTWIAISYSYSSAGTDFYRVGIEGGVVTFRHMGQHPPFRTSGAPISTGYPYRATIRTDSFTSVPPVRIGTFGNDGQGYRIAASQGNNQLGAIEVNDNFLVRQTPLTESVIRSVGSINKEFRWRGNDRGVPTTNITWCGFADVMRLTDETDVYFSVFLNIDDFQTNPTTNMDSINHMRLRVFNKFGEEIKYMYYPWNGRGVCASGWHTRNSADPYDEAVYCFELHNIYGYSRRIYMCTGSWIGSRNSNFASRHFQTVAPATWMQRSECPSNLSATVISESKIQLTWTPPANGGTQAVYYRVKGSQNWVLVTSGLANSVNSYTITGLSASTTYDVMTHGSTGFSWSEVRRVKTLASAPPAPAVPAPMGLAAAAISTSQIQLTWSGTVSGYNVGIYRDGTFIAWAGDGATSYVDSGLGAGTSHTYKVHHRRIADNVDSSFSNEASSTTQTVAPSGSAPHSASALSNGTSSINVSFTNPGDAARIEYGTDGVSFPNATGYGVVSPTTIGGLAANTTYYFRVRNTYGVSNITNAATDPIIYREPDPIDRCVTLYTSILAVGEEGNFYWKLAKDIMEGDLLASVNVQTGDIIVSKAKSIYRGRTSRVYTLIAEGGQSVDCSPTHPIITKFGDTFGKHMLKWKTNDSVLVYNEELQRIEESNVIGIEYVDVDTEVLILEMESDEHTYISGGIVSHNIAQKPMNTL